MNQLAIWQILQSEPQKLSSSEIDLEQHLEDWIERDPSLLQEGLTIVGRQLTIAGGRLDLLAVDPQGRWVVIEIKAGQVRRETVAQVIDYASSISTLPWEKLRQSVETYLASQDNGNTTLDALDIEEDEPPRDVWMYVVGTGREPGLDRMVSYLSDIYNVPLSVVSYEVFGLTSGEQLMIRELLDGEGTQKEVQATSRHSTTIEEMRAVAKQAGIGPSFELLLQLAKRHGFYPRPYKYSVMYTPPQNKTRMLFTVKIHPDKEGNLPLYIWAEPFAEFYDVSQADAEALLGGPGWRSLSERDVRELVARINQLLSDSKYVEA